MINSNISIPKPLLCYDQEWINVRTYCLSLESVQNCVNIAKQIKLVVLDEMGIKERELQ